MTVTPLISSDGTLLYKLLIV